MFDTVNMYYQYQLTIADVEKIGYRLEGIEERQSDKSGYCITGSLNNCKVYVRQTGIVLLGSLSKYLYGSNLFTLTRDSTQRAVEKMSDEMGIDVSLARVMRADVSTVFPMKNTPVSYYDCLLDKSRYKRQIGFDDTLCYTIEKRQLVFYDKRKEAATKGVMIPPTLQGSNLLRYEMRLKHRIGEQLGLERVRVENLYDDETYYKIVQLWSSEYEAINKIQASKVIMEGQLKPKMAKDRLTAELMMVVGANGVDNIVKRVAEDIGDKKSVSRFKQEVKRLMEMQSVDDGRIDELTNCVRNYAKYAK